MHGDDSETADTMRERGETSRVKLWLFMEASRWTVAGLLVAAVFVALVGLGSLDPLPLSAVIQSSDPVETLFQALTGGIITGVTLVVSINSLVLSQELGPLGDQRSRMDGALSFRSDLADTIDEPVVPADPAAFLATIVTASRDRAERLRETAEGVGDATLQDRVDDYVEGIVDNADTVDAQLDGAAFGTFDVVSAALDYNYSEKLHEARRLRNAHADAFSEATRTALDDLCDVLELYGPAREHVKTLYFQWELVDLTQAVVYAAVPALVVSIGSLLFLNDGGTITGTVLGISNLLVVVSAATAVAVLPYAILLSYILRIATVAKRTLAIGPFVLRET